MKDNDRLGLDDSELQYMWRNYVICFVRLYSSMLHRASYRISLSPISSESTLKECVVVSFKFNLIGIEVILFELCRSWSDVRLYFFIRSILNIMYDSLNILCCSYLITRSVFVIMRCRSYKWCSSLIITCCAFINCRAACYFMYCR